MGAVVNQRQMGSHLLSSSSLLPCLKAGPLWRDLPILHEKFKILILCSNTHLKIAAITLETKKHYASQTKCFCGQISARATSVAEVGLVC